MSALSDSDKDRRIAKLTAAVRDLHWMARRYADGSMTYAPGMVNRHVRRLLAEGVELTEPLFARDGMERRYDELSDAEAAAAEADMPKGHAQVVREREERVAALSAERDTALATADALQATLNYLLQENGDGKHPTILDLCFTAFMRSKAKNDEDGGPTDWFTDTRPLIIAQVERLRITLATPTTPPPRLYTEADLERETAEVVARERERNAKRDAARADTDALRDERDAAALAERSRMADALDAEADMHPCHEDAQVYRYAAWLVRANFSHDDAETVQGQFEKGDASARAALAPGAAGGDEWQQMRKRMFELRESRPQRDFTPAEWRAWEQEKAVLLDEAWRMGSRSLPAPPVVREDGA